MTTENLYLPAPTSGYRDPPDDRAPAPFDARELRAVALRPDRVIQLVLVERARLTRTVASDRSLVLLAAILLAASVLSTLPYGAVLGAHRALRIAALTVGSVGICFPTLHVFGSYLGGRNSLGQNLVLALLVSTVAGLFALSFAPIVWFIALTTPDGSLVAGYVSVGLLAVAVTAGIAHFARATQDPALAPDRTQRVVLVAWVGLLCFIVYRMGVFLELV